MPDSLPKPSSSTWPITGSRPPASYYGRVSKAQVIAAVTEAVSAKDALPLAALKKDDLVKAAEKMLAAKRWLPAILRAA